MEEGQGLSEPCLSCLDLLELLHTLQGLIFFNDEKKEKKKRKTLGFETQGLFFRELNFIFFWQKFSLPKFLTLGLLSYLLSFIYLSYNISSHNLSFLHSSQSPSICPFHQLPPPPLLPFRKDQVSQGYEQNKAQQVTIRLETHPHAYQGWMRQPHRRKRVPRVDERIRETPLLGVPINTRLPIIT